MKYGFVVMLTVLIVGCGSEEPVSVPDLTGLPLDEARERADGFDLEEEDGSGGGRGVWSSSNWMVEVQDPPAGTPVEPGSRLTLKLVNVRDVDEAEEPEEPEEAEEAETEVPVEEEPSQPGPDESVDGPDEQELVAQVEQGYAWFAEDRVSVEDDYEMWMVQGSVDSVTDFRVLGSFFLVETGLHSDNPDSGWIAERLCGVASSHLYETSITRVEVEASNGNRLARCNVFQG